MYELFLELCLPFFANKIINKEQHVSWKSIVPKINLSARESFNRPHKTLLCGKPELTISKQITDFTSYNSVIMLVYFNSCDIPIKDIGFSHLIMWFPSKT